ncbi:hypothetical protein [Brevundimonas sp. AAP58]|uniref:hypothetical protein n=1 Tax=Brevundimonas sp. AAP58 TaxID=1523422 RepID=UPI000B0DCB47|nr:hypothetical protein [Brevundimonas sp. AAP58]
MHLDKRASDILLNTYWSSNGWRRDPTVAPDDFNYAKSKGLMFDPVRLSHDQAILAALNAASAVGQEDVANAFIASLGSRRLDLRSCLGSYAVVRHLREHRMSARNGPGCDYCGEYDHDKAALDLNVLSFERIKWGGVRHSQPSYIAFDLDTLRKTPRPSPSARDFAMLKLILHVAASMPPAARLSDLDKALAKVLPSNSAERRVLIGILGYAGIITDPTRSDFRQRFVPCEEREQTPWHKDDWPYPVQWWTGSHGVQMAAITDWFPRLADF